jgi:hypothetical protein
MITGVVSEQDYVEAQRVHRQRLAAQLNWSLAVVAACGVALAVAGVKPWGLIAAIAGLGGLIGEAIQARLYIPAQARKHYHQFKGIEAPITYRWNSETISVQSERGAGERKWNDILKVRESEHVFLLYTTDVLFEVVPKRWFENAEQALEFGTLAKGRRET